MRPMIASRSDAPNTTRRAGDSFIEKAKNRIRASVIARLCQGIRFSASTSTPRVKNLYASRASRVNSRCRSSAVRSFV